MKNFTPAYSTEIKGLFILKENKGNCACDHAWCDLNSLTRKTPEPKTDKKTNGSADRTGKISIHENVIVRIHCSSTHLGLGPNLLVKVQKA